jgi:hypothetical protein
MSLGPYIISVYFFFFREGRRMKGEKEEGERKAERLKSRGQKSDIRGRTERKKEGKREKKMKPPSSP